MSDKILDDISHRRYNPLTNEWVLVSPHRTKRPWQGQKEAAVEENLPDYDPKCYLCPRNSRASGDENPDYQKTHVFVNDFSALVEQQPDYAADESSDSVESRLLKARGAKGRCYVVMFTPRHNVTIADMTPAEIVPTIDLWTRIYANHLSVTNPLRGPAERLALSVGADDAPRPPYDLQYMQIFENKGAVMGCSNPHPHGQIWTSSHVPGEVQKELNQMAAYRRQHGGHHLLGDYVELELSKAERVVWHNAAFAVICPWWAVWPFEVIIIPRRHVRALVDLTADERLQFAEAIQEVARRYDNLFQCRFPYSAGIHQAPLKGTEEEIECSYLHMHFYPPLLRSATVKKFLVGFELLAEPQRDITPEQATTRLQSCGGTLYRKS
ncbi:Galactose-1-phosphate uridylyltransferase [Escovopsis weberi]|uniref:Galactose-1-phosphate uridylyltransferase n=1 Tax=Escovopsis weberi TaxID=150374 RepID=A0A0M8N5R0_ESCWE|nr:Galactose-1-phosphate uridylyltransferase [Escovopsis weberi]